mmetsp:Transcript_38396/g.122267  ORF Transcript_38396/g.122267 Transcript_38396/m.122267 type:complete len:263 (-) Transcript_38396:280-1068(-)
MAAVVSRAAARSLVTAASGPEAVFPRPQQRLLAQVSTARLPSFDGYAVGVLQLSLPHNIWSEHSLNGVQLACMRPGSLADAAAFRATRALQAAARCATILGGSGERNWLRRLLFLSALSGAPSCALQKRGVAASGGDKWVQGLLKEAGREQARLDMLLHLQHLHAPGALSRTLMATTQAAFSHGFWLAHLASPKFCRCFLGYAEEEHIKAYSKLLEDIDEGRLPQFSSAEAPAPARAHYGLPEGAPLREVFKCMLAEGMLSR